MGVSQDHPYKPFGRGFQQSCDMPGSLKGPFVESRRALFGSLELVECTQISRLIKW